MRRTYRTLNGYEMQHNAEVGLFTKPSNLQFTKQIFDDNIIMIQDGTHVGKKVAAVKKISPEDSGYAQDEQPIKTMDRTVIYNSNSKFSGSGSVFLVISVKG